jgi:hypothetical protein
MGLGTERAPSNGRGPLALEWIEEIKVMTNPVLRNLWVTQTYHEISRELRPFLGSDHASWFAFAKWASKQAGRTIRGEDVPERVRILLEKDEQYHLLLDRLNGRLVVHFESAAVRREHVATHVLALVNQLSEKISGGNIKVFVDLAPIFSRFLELFGHDSAPDHKKFARFISELDTVPAFRGRDQSLHSAFKKYYDARFEQDRKAKAELVLTGNALVGVHEQTSLQSDIENGLGVPAHEVQHWMATGIKAGLPFHRHHEVDVALEPHLNPLARLVNHVWCKEATDHLMRLTLPEKALHMGQDVPVVAGQPMFPEELQELEHEDLVAIARQYDRSWNTTVGSKAHDWTRLSDRLHYILDLFRSHHRQMNLYGECFTEEQLQAMRAGKVPAGPL